MLSIEAKLRVESRNHLFYSVFTDVINSVPYQLERPEFLVPLCNPEWYYHLFHLRLNSGLFHGVSAIPVNSGQFWVEWEFRPVIVLPFLKKKNLSCNYVVLHLKSDVHRSIHTCKASILTGSKTLNS